MLKKANKKTAQEKTTLGLKENTTRNSSVLLEEEGSHNKYAHASQKMKTPRCCSVYQFIPGLGIVGILQLPNAVDKTTLIVTSALSDGGSG